MSLNRLPGALKGIFGIVAAGLLVGKYFNSQSVAPATENVTMPTTPVDGGIQTVTIWVDEVRETHLPPTIDAAAVDRSGASFLDSIPPNTFVLAMTNDSTTARWATLATELANIAWFTRYIFWPALVSLIALLQGLPSHFPRSSRCSPAPDSSGGITDSLISCKSRPDGATKPRECAGTISAELVQSRYEAAERNMENTLTLMHDVLDTYSKDVEEAANQEAARTTAMQKEAIKREKARLRAEELQHQLKEEAVQRVFENKRRNYDAMQRLHAYITEKQEKEKEAQRLARLEARQKADEEERRKIEDEATVKAEQQLAAESQRQVAETERRAASERATNAFIERIRTERANRKAERDAGRKAAKEAARMRVAQATERKTEANQRKAAPLEELRQRDLAEQRSQKEEAERRQKVEQERARAQRDRFNKECEELHKQELVAKLHEKSKLDEEVKTNYDGETKQMKNSNVHSGSNDLENRQTPAPTSKIEKQDHEDHDLEEQMIEVMRLNEETYGVSHPIDFDNVDEAKPSHDQNAAPLTLANTITQPFMLQSVDKPYISTIRAPDDQDKTVEDLEARSAAEQLKTPEDAWQTLEVDRAVHATPDELARRKIARVRKPNIRSARGKQQSTEAIPLAPALVTVPRLRNILASLESSSDTASWGDQPYKNGASARLVRNNTTTPASQHSNQQTDVMDVDHAAEVTHEEYYADFTDSTPMASSKAAKRDEVVEEYKKLQSDPADLVSMPAKTNDDHEMTEDLIVTQRELDASYAASSSQSRLDQTQSVSPEAHAPTEWSTSQWITTAQPQSDTQMQVDGPLIEQHDVVGPGFSRDTANTPRKTIVQNNHVAMPLTQKEFTMQPTQPSVPVPYHRSAPQMHQASVMGQLSAGTGMLSGWHPPSGAPTFVQGSSNAPGLTQLYPQGYLPQQGLTSPLGQNQPARPVRKITKDSSPEVKRNASYEEWLAADEDTRVRINNLRKKVKRAPYE